MTTATIPPEIRRALGRVAARLRTVDVLKGIGTVAIVATIGAVVGMAADFAWPLTSAARWGIWSAWVAVATILATIAVARPMFRRLAPIELAAIAGRGQPELGEGLVGSVALLAGGERAHGSRALIDALAARAAAGAHAFRPGRAIPAGRAVARLMIGLILVGLVATPPLLRPDPFGTLARRFLAPWLDLDRVGRVVLRVEPGDRTVALGSDLTIGARLSPRIDLGGPAPDAAWLEWDDAATGKSGRARMATRPTDAPGSRAFEAKLPAIAGAIRYRVTTAPASSRRFTIDAVEPPSLATLSAIVEPPAYTKLPTGPARDPSRLEVVEGSVITFSMVAKRGVEAVEFSWPGPGGPDEPGRTIDARPGPDRKTATIRVVASEAGSYAYSTRLRRDEFGLDGPRESRKLVVRPDAPPTLVARPVEAKEAGADDVLTVPLSARDDFAVASAELHHEVTRAGGEGEEPETGVLDLPIDGLGTPRASGEAALGLKSLGLRPGDTLRYRLRVADNRPGPVGPNVVWSEPGSLAIVARAEPILARRDRLRRENIKERIEEIKKENLSNRQETAQHRYAADAARINPAAWDKERALALAGRAGSARKVVDDLNTLARDLADDPTYRPLAGPAKEIADVEAEAGHAALDAARKADDPVRRLAELRGADSRLGAVHHRIEELQQQFDALARVDKDHQRLRELAAREDALAAEAARDGTDKAARDALLAEQEAVNKDLDNLANTSPDLKAGLLDAQAIEAAALAAKARDLAARQRDEARKTAEGTKGDAALKALAEAQRQIEVDARRLALDVDEPLMENGRGRLNARPLQEAVAPIERGEVEEGRRRLEEAENELRKLARDLEDVPDDPHALARRLVKRQEELTRHVAEAVREFKGRAAPDDNDRAALSRGLKPLADEQAAILKLARAIGVDEPRKAPAREAVEAVDRALKALGETKPREAEARQDDARDALNRLAEALPDHWRRDEPARKDLEEARKLADEATRDVDRHLRETAPEPGKTDDPAKLAVELARRLEPLAKREAEAVARLESMDVSPRVDPQRRRAVRRAKAVATTMEAIRKQAEPLARAQGAGPMPIRDWKVAGPFRKDERPPFALNEPIKTSAKFRGLKGEVSWKSTTAEGDHGKVDLGALYSKADDQSAFAAATLDSPQAGPARFSIGSDDTLAVWVNGKQVYKFESNRSYSPGQDTFAVVVPKGISRVVVRCGNIASEWAFGVEVALPTASSAELARIETLRSALPQAVAESRAALDRLSQKLHGQTPADDMAEELADDAADLARRLAKPDPAARRDLADDAHRLATALRSLPAPDAPTLQAEAVRLADVAARALDDPKADPAAAVARAASASRTLSDRLNDRLSPRGEAVALAEAERALGATDPTAQGRQQRAIVGPAARLEVEATPHPNPPPQGGREPDKTKEEKNPSPLEGEGRVGGRPANDAARAEVAASLDSLAKRADTAPPLAEAPSRPRPLPDAPHDPSLDPLRARLAEAKALARRERKVREGLQAVLGERVAPQEALRQEAAKLGRELADLRDRSREPSPRGRGNAEAAAELLTNQAPRAMEDGVDDLARGRPEPARDAQRRAAELIERAAQAAEDLARNLKADRPADAAPADLRPARDALAEARRRLADEAGAPAQGVGKPPGESASKAMQRAAQAMRTAARPGKGQGPPDDAPPALAGDGTTLDPRSAPAGVAPADLSQLQEMVRQKSGRNWGELPGHLRTEILQLSQGKYREDYARLIGLYFKEIAADAAKPESK